MDEIFDSNIHALSVSLLCLSLSSPHIAKYFFYVVVRHYCWAEFNSVPSITGYYGYGVEHFNYSIPDLSPFLLDLDLDLDMGSKDSDLDLDLKAMDLDLNSDLEVLPASPFSSPLYLQKQ